MPRTFYDADNDQLYGHRGVQITPGRQTPSARAGECAEAWLRLFRSYRARGMDLDEAKLRADCETPDA